MALLDEMIAEATVDAYGEDEQLVGFYTLLDEHVAVPFQTVVLGVDVTVERIDLPDRGGIMAICSRGGDRQTIDVLDLPLPDPPPAGADWIEAYRRWSR
ncbi:calcium-binding protein [Cryptosporangium sp. NPDC051539]|uniref:calcium-binding protein n=1 Tax=Cryptosporangium sp. NPDC051539 TaxID=3363962 RepID=UPI0037B71252